MVKALTYDNPDHKIKLKIRQFQVMGKSTRQINNTGYEWYIGSQSKSSVREFPSKCQRSRNLTGDSQASVKIAISVTEKLFVYF